MNPKSLLFFAACSTLAFSAAHAQSVETDPVGYVTFTLNANSDLKVGLPLQADKTLSASVLSVSGGDVTVNVTLPDLTSEPHFLLITSDGGLQGRWFVINSTNGSVVSVSENLQAAGLTSSDTIAAVKFWTLDSVFPNGGGVPASSDVFSPAAQVFVNDVNAQGVNLTPTSAYLYHDGTQGPAGWYDVNNLGSGLVGSTVINPETFIILRNGTGTPANIVFSGVVPTSPLATSILSRSVGPQDSLIFNPYPAAITLEESGLVASGAILASSDVFSPVDQLFLFNPNSTGVNTTPISAYLYHDGAQGPAGWYDVNDLGAGLQGSVSIPAGAPILIRKSSGSDSLVYWNPPVPYNL